jgi:hypothetical protein
MRLLHRACIVHAAPELRLLSRIIATVRMSRRESPETDPSACQDAISPLLP